MPSRTKVVKRPELKVLMNPNDMQVMGQLESRLGIDRPAIVRLALRRLAELEGIPGGKHEGTAA